MPTTRETGRQTENLAADYLKRQGLKILTRNFNSRFGEIDLVMEDRETLVFIEVRFRRDNRYGGSLASITPVKQKRLIAAAHTYLQYHPQYCRKPARFDAILIQSRPTPPGYHIDWVQNAFQVDT